MKGLSTKQGDNRIIEFEGTFNFRDLGGYETTDGKRVKWGKLFRSGKLDELSQKDQLKLNQLGVSSICDLRDKDELMHFPTPEMPFIKWHHVPVIGSEGEYRQVLDLTEELIKYSKPGELLKDLNEKFIAHTNAFRQVFDVLLEENNGAVLFHCMAGKDRTGVMAALILSVLGVPREVILEDYLLTNRSLDRLKIGLSSNRNKYIESINSDVLEAMIEARTEYIQAFFAKIEENYESVIDYVMNAVGLTECEIEKLQAKFLDEK
ncbi:tyrosine-protein phosphatase [Bacillus sp. JCM 19034]|uniref:tyrosine-protein phosphatase n=1 Tax=Bacillus sp. JCM 19034 TaxID=1481928 RepID=UPI00078639CB|nr:tyrosine-protein phosphatase [Bacillus sp. JCM 19034]